MLLFGRFGEGHLALAARQAGLAGRCCGRHFLWLRGPAAGGARHRDRGRRGWSDVWGNDVRCFLPRAARAARGAGVRPAVTLQTINPALSQRSGIHVLPGARARGAAHDAGPPADRRCPRPTWNFGFIGSRSELLVSNVTHSSPWHQHHDAGDEAGGASRYTIHPTTSSTELSS